MSTTQAVKLPPRDKWPEGATHFQSNGDRERFFSTFWRVEDGKVREGWSVNADYSVSDHATYGPEGFLGFVLDAGVELPADPVIDWSAAPEGFPLWIAVVGSSGGPSDDAKDDWHRDDGDRYRDRDGRHWRKVSEGVSFIVYRKPEQVTSQPAEAPVIDWSNGPADATHWGANEHGEEGAMWFEAFYKLEGCLWKYSLASSGAKWRTAVLPSYRVASLIERPAAAIKIEQVIVPEPAPIVIKAINSSEDAFDALHEAFESKETLTVSGRSFRLVMVGRDFDGAGTKCVRADIQQVVQAAWSGEDLPPAGTVCEHQIFGCEGWSGATVLAYGEKKTFYRDSAGHEWSRLSDEIKFRPIQTPEQIAAAKRESAARQICIDAGSVQCTEQQMKTAYQLYDKGYRKQVAP